MASTKEILEAIIAKKERQINKKAAEIGAIKAEIAEVQESIKALRPG